jgi:16S rRNA (cytosine967-C5)-methyltransferase
MTDARRLAYQVLLNLEKQASYPDRLLRAALLRHPDLKDEDRALFTELVYGVLRWQGTLDWHIDQLSNIKPRKVAPEIRLLLRLALYQILCLSRVPDHAAVNEAVKIVKSSQPPHLAGFVNALLREAIRREGRWDWPSPASEPEAYLAITTSHPQWFVQRSLKEFGFEETQSFCQANNTIASLVLRVNPRKILRAELLDQLREDGARAEPSPYLPEAVRLSGLRQDLARQRCYQEGWIHVQDEASQLVSLIVDPRPGERILDLCAGFGGKTTHLGLLMDDAGAIVAVDQSSWKLQELQQNARRQDLNLITTVAGDARELPPTQLGSFDRVLLDAPCSGFGTLRRKPDIKWRRHPKDPYRFSQLQRELLHRASLLVREGGILVYATCTVFSEEDEAVAADFGKRHEDWVLEPVAGFLPEACREMVHGDYFKSWPHRHGVDGFFAARWRRMESRVGSSLVL